MLNPKHEIRNSKQAKISKIQNKKTVWDLENLNLKFV